MITAYATRNTSSARENRDTSSCDEDEVEDDAASLLSATAADDVEGGALHSKYLKEEVCEVKVKHR